MTPGTQTHARPRTDGLYLNHEAGDPIRWLRFYADNELAWVWTSPGPATQIAQWLKREDPARKRVAWGVADGRLSFHLSYRSYDWVKTGPTSGTRREMPHEVDYAGPLEDDRLLLVRREEGVADVAEHYWFQRLAPEDFAGPKRRFPRIKSLATLREAGLSAASIARVKKARGVRRDDLYVLPAEEIVAKTNIPLAEAAALVRWRDGR